MTSIWRKRKNPRPSLIENKDKVYKRSKDWRSPLETQEDQGGKDKLDPHLLERTPSIKEEY